MVSHYPFPGDRRLDVMHESVRQRRKYTYGHLREAIFGSFDGYSVALLYQKGGVSLKDSLLMRNHIILDVNAFKLVSNYSDKNKSSGCLPDFLAISRSAGRLACN